MVIKCVVCVCMFSICGHDVYAGFFAMHNVSRGRDKSDDTLLGKDRLIVRCMWGDVRKDRILYR